MDEYYSETGFERTCGVTLSVDFVAKWLHLLTGNETKILVYMFQYQMTFFYHPTIDWLRLATGTKTDDGRYLDRGVGLSEDEIGDALASLQDRGLIYHRVTTDESGKRWYGWSLTFQPPEDWVSPEEQERLEAEFAERRALRKRRRAEFAKIRDKVFGRILERDGGKCRHCGTTEYLSIDHIVAIGSGGSDDDENLQILCRSCNSRKSDH